MPRTCWTKEIDDLLKQYADLHRGSNAKISWKTFQKDAPAELRVMGEKPCSKRLSYLRGLAPSPPSPNPIDEQLLKNCFLTCTQLEERVLSYSSSTSEPTCEEDLKTLALDDSSMETLVAIARRHLSRSRRSSQEVFVATYGLAVAAIAASPLDSSAFAAKLNVHSTIIDRAIQYAMHVQHHRWLILLDATYIPLEDLTQTLEYVDNLRKAMTDNHIPPPALNAKITSLFPNLPTSLLTGLLQNQYKEKQDVGDLGDEDEDTEVEGGEADKDKDKEKGKAIPWTKQLDQALYNFAASNQNANGRVDWGKLTHPTLILMGARRCSVRYSRGRLEMDQKDPNSVGATSFITKVWTKEQDDWLRASYQELKDDCKTSRGGLTELGATTLAKWFHRDYRHEVRSWHSFQNRWYVIRQQKEKQAKIKVAEENEDDDDADDTVLPPPPAMRKSARKSTQPPSAGLLISLAPQPSPEKKQEQVRVVFLGRRKASSDSKLANAAPLAEESPIIIAKEAVRQMLEKDPEEQPPEKKQKMDMVEVVAYWSSMQDQKISQLQLQDKAKDALIQKLQLQIQTDAILIKQQKEWLADRSKLEAELKEAKDKLKETESKFDESEQEKARLREIILMKEEEISTSKTMEENAKSACTKIMMLDINYQDFRHRHDSIQPTPLLACSSSSLLLV